MPKRIQRKRSKGWRMPENTVYVGRPTVFGNPYIVGQFFTAAEAIKQYRYLWEARLDTYRDRDEWHRLIENLTGHDLACWCKEGEACHADVLLKLANEEG